MAGKRKGSGKAMAFPSGIAKGVGIGLLVTLVGAMILSYLISSEKVTQDGIGVGCMIIQVVSSLAGSVSACKAIRHRFAMVTGFACGGYYLSLLLLSLLFGGATEGLGVTAVMVALGGVIGRIPALFRSGSGGRRRKIPAYR